VASSHQFGDGICQSEWIYWMRDASLCARPGRKPGILLAGNEQQDRRAIKDFIFELTGNSHATLWSGLSIKNENIDRIIGLWFDSIYIETKGIGGCELTNLVLAHLWRKASAKGALHGSPDSGIIRVENDVDFASLGHGQIVTIRGEPFHLNLEGKKVVLPTLK
jgi:hypothetical protein